MECGSTPYDFVYRIDMEKHGMQPYISENLFRPKTITVW